MIGTVLSNRYKLIAELGSGGMAWVYLADDLVNRKKVAVKVLYPQHSQDLGFLQRFIREAKLSMSLCQGSPQPNIACVLDYGADRDTRYLVMEYVPGRDLGQILEQQGPLPWRRALDVACQVALALAHARRRDIVHRDIKPSNIMVCPDGKVRVLDFGIARARSSPSLTLSGFVGSPHYAAPEQATGQPVDIRADLYSLGIVLYRMLSGNLPFQGDTPWAVVNQHMVSEPPALAACCPDLPQAVVDIVQTAMAKRPEDRFQSPEEMAQAIDTVLDSPDLLSEPLPTAPAQTAAALETLYQRAQQAAEAEKWQEAVDLYSQILKIDPNYRDATEQLAEAGRQIRLASLYRSALRALHSSQWDQALAQLDTIAEIEPDYKDVRELRMRAEERERPSMDADFPAAEFPTQIPSSSMPEAGSVPATAASVQGRSAQAQAPSGVPRRRRGLLWVAMALLVSVSVAAIYFLLFAQGEPTSTPAADVRPSATLSAQATPTPASTAVAASPTPLVAGATPLVASPEPTLTSPAVRTPATRRPTESPTPTPLRPSATPSATPSLTPAPTPTPTVSPAPTAVLVRPSRKPLRGQVAFPRFDPARGTYDLYVCGVDGSACRQLMAEASQPDFLPDGSQLVVHSWKNDAKGLVLVTASGQPIWRITDQIEAARPSVDYRGESYVYISRQESDRQPRLYRTVGTENRPIRREASEVVGQSPSWLPDRRILYTGCWLNSCGILVMESDGTFPRQIVAGAEEANPEASPDGRRVVFMSFRDRNWEIYIVNLDGGHLRRLTRNPANDGLPTWSPDGEYIAFVTDRDGPWAAWVMRPDGSEQRRLFDLGGPLDGRVRTAAAHETHGWVEERISWGP